MPNPETDLLRSAFAAAEVRLQRRRKATVVPPEFLRQLGEIQIGAVVASPVLTINADGEIWVVQIVTYRRVREGAVRAEWHRTGQR